MGAAFDTERKKTGTTKLNYANALQWVCREAGNKVIHLFNTDAAASLKYKLLARYSPTQSPDKEDVLTDETVLTYGQDFRADVRKKVDELVLQVKSYDASETVVEDCEDTWAESDPVTGVTVSTDNADYQVGTKSAKMAMGATAAAGILATEAISSADLSSKDIILVWIKSSIAITAGQLQLLLDDHALCASPTETLNLPALTANTWTRVELTLANPASDTAIISVGIKQTADLGAFNLWIDDVRAVTNCTWEVNWVG